MLDVNKKIHFDGVLSTDATVERNSIAYTTFLGDVTKDGVPSMSYYISDENIYKSNLKAFREAWTNFQNIVFDEADKVTAALEAATTEV